MSVRVNVCMSNIMCAPIKLGIRTYATYANCRTLQNLVEKVLNFIYLKFKCCLRYRN